MEIIFKASACALISVILSIVVGVRHKELSVVLTVAVCCMIAIAMLTYLRPAMDFMDKLCSLGNIDHVAFGILLKSTGIAILGEVTTLICSDAGNNTLGKVIHMLTAVVILWISLPILNQMLDLLNGILGSI